LSLNKIKKLEGSITKAVNLQKLKLNNNNLIYIAPDARDFLTFVDVEMEGNPLKSLTDTLDESFLEKLQLQQYQQENDQLKEKIVSLENQIDKLSRVKDFQNVHTVQKDLLNLQEEIGKGGFSIIYNGV